MGFAERPLAKSVRGAGVKVDKFTAAVAEDDEHEEQAKGECGDHEEVDRDELAEVRSEKDAPRGRGLR